MLFCIFGGSATFYVLTWRSEIYLHFEVDAYGGTLDSIYLVRSVESYYYDHVTPSCIHLQPLRTPNGYIWGLHK